MCRIKEKTVIGNQLLILKIGCKIKVLFIMEIQNKIIRLNNLNLEYNYAKIKVVT